MGNTVGSPEAHKHDVLGDPVTTEAKSRNGLVKETSHYTPASLDKEKRNIPEYISGYVDGEGCFTVTFNKRAKARLGWELRPSFSVSQNEDRRQVLDLIREYFGCGYIRRDYNDRTVKYEVRDQNDLALKIIPHFERFPLLSEKRKDFELFRKICEIVTAKSHLKKDGFADVITLAYQMNGSGKRKRRKEEIFNSLR
ncbi:MAG: LAGLIDADG family homing endonuclease [Candidatus Colwellbacteria bacterium]|nr:LAGLIDADG family homing endonuclease [Candidatus Colwellbacteria bacterium]